MFEFLDGWCVRVLDAPKYWKKCNKMLYTPPLNCPKILYFMTVINHTQKIAIDFLLFGAGYIIGKFWKNRCMIFQYFIFLISVIF